MALAADWQARLVLLHVLAEQTPLSVSDQPTWRRPPDPQLAAKTKMSRGIQAAKGIQVEVLVETGDPAECILEVARRFYCGILLTGVSRDETLARLLLRTTLDTLVRKAPVPVLVVKSRPHGPYHNAVVATDFSKGSRRALETALTWLPLARVSIFHCFDILQDYVDVQEMDLVVLGNTGRSAVASIFLGSVAQSLLSRLEVDMLVVGRDEPGGGPSAD